MREARSPASSEPSDQAIKAGSKSFALASRLFAPATRPLVWDLYAWCRHCDDVIDGQVSGHGQTAVTDAVVRLARLRTDTAAAFTGRADAPTPFGALQRVVTATGLPDNLASDHLDGFAFDVERKCYDTLDDVLEYSYHVAGVVGLMMAWVMGVRDPAVLLRASDLGIAFQLSNIARDVADDAISGRVYLPRQWLADAGVTLTPGRGLDAVEAGRLIPVVIRLLDESERYYASAQHGLPHLPGRSAWAVATARLVYRAIGQRVRSRGADAWSSRTVVSAPSKLWCVLLGGAHAGWTRVPVRPAPSRQGLFTPARVDMLR